MLLSRRDEEEESGEEIESVWGDALLKDTIL